MSSISNSTSYGSAFRILFEAIDDLESLYESTSAAFFSARSSNGSVSQVTVSAGVSQVTVPNVPSSTGGETATVTSAVSVERSGEQRADQGLGKDHEGIETRKEMVIRRRKECSVEEVDVALAPIMKVPVPYSFYPDQYKAFRKLFPRVNVSSGLHYNHHDHPVAHTATMVGIRFIQSMLKPGDVALDLYGNPNGNDQFNRFKAGQFRKRKLSGRPPVIETMVNEETAADSVRRVTKWGDEFDADGNRRYFKGGLEAVPHGKYKTFISIHSLYYLSMYRVNEFLHKNPGAKMICLVNYSKETQGKLYGELSYSKTGGMTTQTSPNGERYTHPDIDSWFQQNSFRGWTETVPSGISWTSTCVGGPLYALTITSCPWGLARPIRYDPPGEPTLLVQKDRSFLSIVRFGGKTVNLRVTNAEFAIELRSWMTFRDRTDPEVFNSLVVKARRMVSKDAVMDTKQYDVAVGDLKDHIVYAFCVDAGDELELLDGVKVLNGDVLAPLSEALKFQGNPKVNSLLTDVLSVFLGPTEQKKVLGLRGKHNHRNNSGGLLPIKRT